MLETLIPTLTALVGVLGTLGTIWFKHKLKERNKEKEVCPVGKCVNEDVELLNKLNEILGDINADRVSIYSFHNGGEFYSGKPMQKMSMSYEVVSSGIARRQIQRQSIPVSACASTLQTLMEKRMWNHPNVKDYPESLCKSYLMEDGVKSTYQWAIIDLNRRAVGMLRVDYIKRMNKLSDKELNKITLNVIKMSGYLNGSQQIK